MGAGVDESNLLSHKLGDKLNEDPTLLRSAGQIAAELANGKIDMVQLVENLGPALTHPVVGRRELGVRMLSRVLAAAPPDLRNAEQLHFLSRFYTDRLRDHHSTLPATLEGYLVLVRAPALPPDAIDDFLAAMFREVSCASQQRADRANIYRILLHVLRSHPQYVRDASARLASGALAAIDGERSPRELLLALELARELTRVELGALADEAFEQLACYFPVDFHPPSDEPVTRADIAAALAPCLCAAPRFAEPCLLLVAEKLDSNLRLAKLDSLRLLELSCESFEPSAYAPFVKTLWASLQREIDNKMDEEMARHARSALTALASRLALPEPHPALVQLTGLVLTCALAAVSNARTGPALALAAAPALACCPAAPSVASLLVRPLMQSVAETLERDTPTDVRDAALQLLTDLHAHALAEPIAELAPRLLLDFLASPEPRYHLSSLRGLTRTVESLSAELAPLLADTLAHRLRRASEPHARESLRCLRALGVAHPQCVTERVLTELSWESRCRALGALAGVEGIGDACVPELLETLCAADAESAGRALIDGVVDPDMCSCDRLEQLERRHGVADRALAWLASVRARRSARSLATDVAARLPLDLQRELLQRHVDRLISECKDDESRVHELEALFCGVRPEALCACEAAFETALRLALHASGADERESGCELAEAILNKADVDRPALLKAARDACTEVESPARLRLVGHVTRALMLRGDPEFEIWLKRVLDGITDGSSEGALELVASTPARLTAARHARASPLHRQRLLHAFAALAPSDASSAPSVARAAVAVLAAAPAALLPRSLQQMAGSVRAALEQDEASVLERALSVLHTALGSTTAPELAPAALLPRLLRLSSHDNMQVRLASLACVLRAADARPTRELLPLRDDVVRQLGEALDDRKRLVRAAAVRARSRWIMIGAPGE